MLSFEGPGGRIIAAALDLAKQKDWSRVTLLEIASQAGVSLAQLREHFSSKTGILRAFIKAVDEEVIKNPPSHIDGETARERLFEVIMNRFDILAPYKSALKSIRKGTAPDPAQMRAILSSQFWMLEAAGINTEGARGAARVAGLAPLYASVFSVWLDDDDPGLARTMARLDRRLKRAEAAIVRLEETACGLRDIAGRLCALAGNILSCRPGKDNRSARDGNDGTSGRSSSGGDLTDDDSGGISGTGPAAPDPVI